jgi:hypothetical protein
MICAAASILSISRAFQMLFKPATIDHSVRLFTSTSGQVLSGLRGRFDQAEFQQAIGRGP